MPKAMLSETKEWKEAEAALEKKLAKAIAKKIEKVGLVPFLAEYILKPSVVQFDLLNGDK